MQTNQTRKPLGRAAVCSVVIAVFASAAAAAASFTGATVPHQTDKVTKNRVTHVKVDCPTGASGSCIGTLTLKTSGKVKQGSTRRILKLGSSNSTIAPGQELAVKVTVSNQAMNLLSHGAIKPNAIAASHDSSGTNAINKTKITLKKKGHGNTSPAPQCGVYGCGSG